jgi:hypothetical protein
MPLFGIAVFDNFEILGGFGYESYEVDLGDEDIGGHVRPREGSFDSFSFLLIGRYNLVQLFGTSRVFPFFEIGLFNRECSLEEDEDEVVYEIGSLPLIGRGIRFLPTKNNNFSINFFFNYNPNGNYSAEELEQESWNGWDVGISFSAFIK